VQITVLFGVLFMIYVKVHLLIEECEHLGAGLEDGADDSLVLCLIYVICKGTLTDRIVRTPRSWVGGWCR